ncbi:MAG TPA: hypothetical protein VF490_19820 [Chryseosolibacter sp.]
MRSKTLLWFTFFSVFCSYSLIAQEDTTRSKISYFICLQTGGAFGKNGHGGSLTNALIQGVRYKRFAFGVGVGYDVHTDWKLVPFFASVNVDLLRHGAGAAYIQMNGGYSKAWAPTLSDSPLFFIQERNPYLNPLVGYRLAAGKLNVYLSAGYKFQHLTYGWTSGWSQSVTTRIERTIERIVVQLGVGFR